jgi:subtilisin family serine protease
MLVLFPLAAFAENVGDYIVVTRHPFRDAIVAIGDDALPGRAGRFVSGFESINGFEATLSDSEVDTLRKSPEVRWIEPVLERHALGRIAALSDQITDGQQTTPFGVTMVHAQSVWPVTKGKSLDPSKPTRVAIIDTGITYDDPELSAAYKGGHNFIDGSDDPRDDAGHGTHVAGTIAAADNGTGVVGIAPDVEIYSLKMLSSCGSGSSANEIRALDWILAKKAAIGGNWIVNLSLGSPDPSAAEQTAFQNAIASGLLIFAAAGNDYDTNPVDGLSYPAAYPGVVSVGAIDSSQTVATFSQRGADLKVVGPGVNVLSTVVAEKVAASNGATYAATAAAAENNSGDSLCLPAPTVSGVVVDSGKGQIGDFPSSVAGKIALIERGDLTFADKAKNAKAAGAIGVICYNSATGDPAVPDLGKLTSASAVPPFVFISRADGLALKATPGVSVSMSFGLHTYALYSGTSMATPHAVGTAALAWSVAPSATNVQVATAIEQTAHDLGDAGFDTVYGNGLVDALAAAMQLNPAAFGSATQPPPAPKYTGRTPGRRGH